MSSTRYRKSEKPPEQIARELDARYLLTATVRREKGQGVDRVEVTPELVEVKAAGAPASRWQHPFAAPVAEVFQLQSDIASRAAEALGVNLAEAQRKQLADKPTQNLAAYDAFLKGEAASGGGIRSDAPSIRKALDLYEQAVALDPRFALAWARIAEQNSIRYFNFSPTPEVAERAREAAEKAVALAPDLPDGYYALGRYYRTVKKDARRSLDEFLKGQKLFPGNSDFLRGISLADQVLGRWQEALENSRKAMRLDPRDVSNIGNLGDVLLRLHRWSESREAFDRALAISPDNLFLIERKAMSFLGEGDLPAARALLKQAQSRVEPTALVAYVASFQDLGWVLDAEQTSLLKRLTPAAFDGDEATWAICLAQACSFAGDSVCVRGFAERALKAFETQLSSSPGDVNLMTGHAIALAYLGRKEDAVHEVENASALWPVAADAQVGPYVRHQLARVAILAGDQEKALDVLEPLLRLPYFLSPGWLKIDPNFDALRGNPRFQKLAAGAPRNDSMTLPAGTQAGPVRDRRAARRGRDGRGVSGAGLETRSRSRDQGPAAHLSPGPGRAGAIRAGGQGGRGAVASEHPRDPRLRNSRRRRLRGYGASGRRDAARQARCRVRFHRNRRSDYALQIARGLVGRPREGGRPPGPEAREPLRHEGRPRQDPRLRPGQEDRAGRRRAGDERADGRRAAPSPGR